MTSRLRNRVKNVAGNSAEPTLTRQQTPSHLRADMRLRVSEARELDRIEQWVAQGCFPEAGKQERRSIAFPHCQGPAGISVFSGMDSV